MEITTIKLTKKTKERLNKLRSHKRDSYDEIVQRMLRILTICRIDPGVARANLIRLEKQKIMIKREFF